METFKEKEMHYTLVMDNGKEIGFQDSRSLKELIAVWREAEDHRMRDLKRFKEATDSYNKHIEQAETLGIDDRPDTPTMPFSERHLVWFDSMVIHTEAIIGIAESLEIAQQETM